MRRLLIYIFAILCGVQVGYSQKKDPVAKDTVLTQNLDEVIISATRTYRQLSSLPLPAQIVPRAELKESNRIRLNNILNEQTGLISVQSFIGGEGIQMQGLNSEYTLILIDGVPLIGRSAGTLDISRITVGNIKQIEIVKGASSSLYGSEALGGVINIITDNPNKEGLKGNVSYNYGTFNTQDGNVNIDFKSGKLSVGTFINRNSSDGYDLVNAVDVNTIDPYSNYTFNAKVNYDFTENTKLFFSGRYFTQNQDYIPTTTESGEIDVREWNTHLKLDNKYNEKWSSYFEFYATRYKTEDYLNANNDGSLFSQSNYNELLIRPEIRATYKPNDNTTFIGGIGTDHETLERSDFSESPIFNSPYIFLQYDATFYKKLNVILGARFDSHNRYDSQFSPKAALRYELNDKIALKGSVGYGFKAPDFRQLYFDLLGIGGYTILGYNVVTTRIPEMIANGEIGSVNDILVPLSFFEGNLKPENSIAYNLGITYNPIQNIRLEVNLFRNDIRDLIENQLIANKVNGSGVYSYYNVNEVYTQGIEVNATWKASKDLKISGGYQLLYAKDKAVEDVFKRGEAFASVPGAPSFRLEKDDYFGLFNRSRHMANLKIYYEYDKLNLNTNLRGTYRSKYGLFDTNSNTYLDKYDEFVEGYSLWNWAINKTFYENYELGFGIDNIFDFTDIPEDANDNVFIANIPGRIIYAKMNINF